MRELKIVKALTRLEGAESLDPLIEKVSGAVHRLIQPQTLRDILHGVPFGHPVHPLLVLVPTGAWTSVALLDLIPGREKSAQTLVALGLAGAVPSVAAGYTDWSELHPQQQRVGIVHAASNATAILLYTASYIQRRRGKQISGKVLAYAGYAAVSGGGFLGGHLSYRQAAGANHAEDVPHRFPQGWHTLAWLDELPDGELSTHEVEGQPVVALRDGDTVDVLSNICSHLSGPLGDGALVDAGTAEPCVSCPWHDSVFSLKTGEVVHGPATAPQPKFETRVVNKLVEVRLPGAE